MDMDTEIVPNLILTSTKRNKFRNAPRKKRRMLKSLEGSETHFYSPSGKIKKNKRSGKIQGRKLKKIKIPTQDCINLIMQEISKKTGSVLENGRVPESPILNQTIDLCDDEGPSGSSRASINIRKNNLRLCKKTNKTEVIDLTGSFMGLNGCDHVENLEPSIVILSEDEQESQSQTNRKGESSDDIFVIGTFSKNSKPRLSGRKKSNAVEFIPLSCRSNKMNSLVNINTKVKKKNLKKKLKSCEDKSKDFCQEVFVKRLQSNLNLACIGENIYSNKPVVLPLIGLRPIIIDGSNVAFVHSKGHNFSCKRLEICIKYFKERGHKVTAFVPQFRTERKNCDNPHLLKKLEEEGDVILTPSKKVDGMAMVPYDDRFIVQTAVLKGGVIVSRDKFKDLLGENPAWAVTIKYRTLAFTWVDDVLMFPKDPLGKLGPSLEEFLSF